MVKAKRKSRAKPKAQVAKPKHLVWRLRLVFGEWWLHICDTRNQYAVVEKRGPFNWDQACAAGEAAKAEGYEREQ